MTKKIARTDVERMAGGVRATVYAEGYEAPAATTNLTTDDARTLALSLLLATMPAAMHGDGPRLAEASRFAFDDDSFLDPSRTMDEKASAFYADLVESARDVSGPCAAELFVAAGRLLRITGVHFLRFADVAEKAAATVREA